MPDRDDDAPPWAPVDELDDGKPKRQHPVKGSPEAMEIGRRLAEARAAKRAKAAEGDDGEPSPPKSAGQNKPPVPQPSSGELRALRSELADSARDLGMLVGPIAPTPGLYLTTTGDDFAAAVIRAAEHNPKLLAYLQKSSSYTAYLAIGSWVAGLLVATWAEVSGGQVPLGVAQRWGIDAMYLETHEIVELEPDGEEGGTADDGQGGAWSATRVPTPDFLGGHGPAPSVPMAAG